MKEDGGWNRVASFLYKKNVWRVCSTIHAWCVWVWYYYTMNSAWAVIIVYDLFYFVRGWYLE